jgi:hypothetical protein
VGGHEDRRAIVGQGLDDVVEAAAGQRVEPRGRLVEEEDLRPAHEPGGDVETAPFAARQLPDPLRLLLGQADGAEQVRSRPRAWNFSGGEGPVVGAQVVEELADPPFRVVAPGLQDGPDPGPPGFAGLPRGRAQYLHPPGGGRAQAFEYLDRGGLAHAVGAEENDHLTAENREVQAVEDEVVSIGDAQAGDLDDLDATGVGPCARISAGPRARLKIYSSHSREYSRSTTICQWPAPPERALG